MTMPREGIFYSERKVSSVQCLSSLKVSLPSNIRYIVFVLLFQYCTHQQVTTMFQRKKCKIHTCLFVYKYMPFQSESIPTYSVCTAVLIILRVSFDHMCNYAFTSHLEAS